MRYLFACLLVLLSFRNSFAQNFTGQISDSSGNPLNAATIFIKEINQGVISDKNGMFQILLKEGDYSLVCQYPGYIDTSCFISISGNDSIYKVFKLKPDSLFTDQKTQKERERDNYANAIIQNCINQRERYLSSGKSHNLNSYIRGRMVIENVSDIVDNTVYGLYQFYYSSLKGQLISTEIYGNIEFDTPQYHNVNVEGYQGYIPETFTQKGVIDFLKESIYSEYFNGFISPLCLNAFRYYIFDYEGYYKLGNTKRHKIKVKSKFNSPDLINGHLFIEEGECYDLSHVILNTEKNGLKALTIITYAQVQESQYQPIALYNDIAFNMVGVTGTIKYYAGLKLNSISKNENKFSVNSENGTKYIVQPNANKRDSSFWRSVRLQPVDADFANQISDTTTLKKREFNLSRFVLGRLLFGGYALGNDTSKISLKYNGVKMIFRDYNYVDGFWLGNMFDLRIRLNNANIEAHPYIYYTTARKRLLGGSDIIYNYDLKRKGQFTVSIGSRSEDFNNLSLSRYQNYFSSLIMGENINFFYQRDFLSLSNSIHLSPKVKASVSLGFDRRSGLSDHTDFNVLGRNKIQPNIFSDQRFDRTYYSIGLFYSPNSNYTITEALDMYNKKVTPAFSIEYQEGFSSWQVNNSKYQKIKGGVSHNIPIDYFNSIDYKIEAGTYIKTDKNMHFTDYQHFGGSDMLLNLSSLFDSFLLLDNYQLQTNRYWVNLFLNYSGRYVLLKFIPFLQRSPFTENLHLKTLFTPDSKSYVETGYSLSFNRFFGIGAFTSFHNVEGRKFGIRFSFNLRSLNFE